jgi:hypothetical protein
LKREQTISCQVNCTPKTNTRRDNIEWGNHQKPSQTRSSFHQVLYGQGETHSSAVPHHGAIFRSRASGPALLLRCLDTIPVDNLGDWARDGILQHDVVGMQIIVGEAEGVCSVDGVGEVGDEGREEGQGAEGADLGRIKWGMRIQSDSDEVE